VKALLKKLVKSVFTNLTKIILPSFYSFQYTGVNKLLMTRFL